MKSRMFRPVTLVLSLILFAPSLRTFAQVQADDRVIISIRDQKLMLVQNGAAVVTYPISTSKYGLGDRWGSLATPLGIFQVAQKIGDHAPLGAVFHRRRWTGEILAPNAPGRDPIITRIIWLRGLEASNAHAFSRCIYIHGTPQEKIIGRPASYGCVRMKSNDVAALYSQLPLGAFVQILPDRLPKLPKAAAMTTRPASEIMASSASVEKPATIPERKGRARPILGSIVRG
jgi:lipoprotein-anchoring transpeptidase ErfK/SrfK